MKLVKKSLGLVLMLGLAVGGIALTGCKKKTSDNITTQKTTTKKEYSFNDVWKVIDRGNYKSLYDGITQNEANPNNSLKIESGVIVGFTARKKVKITKISYTAKNLQEGTKTISIPLDNGNYKKENYYMINTYDSDVEKKNYNITQNENKNISLNYSNFIIEKGEDFYMTFGITTESNGINIYNFSLSYEVIE